MHLNSLYIFPVTCTFVIYVLIVNLTCITKFCLYIFPVGHMHFCYLCFDCYSNMYYKVLFIFDHYSLCLPLITSMPQPLTSKHFYPRFYPLLFFPILIIEKKPVYPFLMLSAKQGHYWYHFL